MSHGLNNNKYNMIAMLVLVQNSEEPTLILLVDLLRKQVPIFNFFSSYMTFWYGKIINSEI